MSAHTAKYSPGSRKGSPSVKLSPVQKILCPGGLPPPYQPRNSATMFRPPTNSSPSMPPSLLLPPSAAPRPGAPPRWERSGPPPPYKFQPKPRGTNAPPPAYMAQMGGLNRRLTPNTPPPSYPASLSTASPMRPPPRSQPARTYNGPPPSYGSSTATAYQRLSPQKKKSPTPQSVFGQPRGGREQFRDLLEFYKRCCALRQRRLQGWREQFERCSMKDFDINPNPIGRGSNGLVFAAKIRADSKAFPSSLRNRKYAIKRRFLYTSEDTFRADFSVPYNHPHYHILEIYGSFRGDVICPDAIEQDHLSGREILFRTDDMDSPRVEGTPTRRSPGGAKPVPPDPEFVAPTGEKPPPYSPFLKALAPPSGEGPPPLEDMLPPMQMFLPNNYAELPPPAFSTILTMRATPPAAAAAAAAASSGTSPSPKKQHATEHATPHKLPSNNIELKLPKHRNNQVEYVIMELATHGDLSRKKGEMDRAGTKYTEREVLKILFQVSLCINFLRTNQIAHRDLKLDNILLLANRYCVSDFGCSLRGLKSNEHNGNPAVMPPEVAKALTSGIEANYWKADVWALGILAYDIIGAPSPIGKGNDVRTYTDPPPRLPAGFERVQVFCDKILQCNDRSRPEASEAVLLLGALLWVSDETAEDAFTSQCHAMIAALLEDERLANFAENDGYCFFATEEEEMQMRFLILWLWPQFRF